jgi:hypothetical protein
MEATESARLKNQQSETGLAARHDRPIRRFKSCPRHHQRDLCTGYSGPAIRASTTNSYPGILQLKVISRTAIDDVNRNKDFHNVSTSLLTKKRKGVKSREAAYTYFLGILRRLSHAKAKKAVAITRTTRLATGTHSESADKVDGL